MVFGNPVTCLSISIIPGALISVFFTLVFSATTKLEFWYSPIDTCVASDQIPWRGLNPIEFFRYVLYRSGRTILLFLRGVGDERGEEEALHGVDDLIFGEQKVR